MSLSAKQIIVQTHQSSQTLKQAQSSTTSWDLQTIQTLQTGTMPWKKSPTPWKKKFSIFQKAFRKHSIKPTIPSLRHSAKQNLKQKQKNQRQCKPNGLNLPSTHKWEPKNPVISKQIPEPQLPCTMQVFTKITKPNKRQKTTTRWFQKKTIEETTHGPKQKLLQRSVPWW